MLQSADTVARTGTTTAVGAAGTSYTYLGLPMADIVGLVTIVYLAVQIIGSLRNFFTRRRNRS